LQRLKMFKRKEAGEQRAFIRGRAWEDARCIELRCLSGATRVSVTRKSNLCAP
jgi:hypothetical protein